MIEPPVSRRLRVLALDPSLASRLETSKVSEITVTLPWEADLQPGPVGEYIEVVDFDPASDAFYRPVDLNHPHLLAQDGLAPSESNPQFHQQMVYAVAMTTVRHFERALGRVAFWSDRKTQLEDGTYVEQFVRRLRLYPHALRDRNAYYSPAKKAVLFGYFPVTAKDAHNTPGTVVFTALSHDIIAHEVTHALLDGVHPRFNEPTNPDVHAFHEAFADIVALFQHFSYPSILESEIRKTRGNLETENLLSQLAQQFGQATGRGGALRDALGSFDQEKGEWKPQEPDPHTLERTLEPHARGAVLVAAVFRAFLLIYRSRSADLFRIASQGTGVLPEGEIHPDLTRRLAAEAAKCADRILQMCIRAIDYCPPVDITFGDFLRGIVTADLDYSPGDPAGFRLVFVQSFREWGIHPRGVLSLGLDALVWPSGEEKLRELEDPAAVGRSKAEDREDLHRRMRQSLKADFLLDPKVASAKKKAQQVSPWNLESDRFEVWKALDGLRWKLWRWLVIGNGTYGRKYAEIFGLVVRNEGVPATVYRGRNGWPAVEIHAIRPAIRRSLYGSPRTDLVIEITQRRRGYFDEAKQERMDRRKAAIPKEESGDFVYRAGCTILIDAATQEIRRVIRTAGTITDDDALRRVRSFRMGETGVTGNAFDAGIADGFKAQRHNARDEPFALLHQSQEVL